MKIDKDFLYSRIRNVRDPKQGGLLQDVLIDVFSHLIEYNDARFQELEKRIDSEIEDDNEKYYIYTAVAKQNDVNEASRFWFRMLGNAADTEAYGVENGVLTQIFLACGYKNICICIDKIFKATVITDKGEYNIDVALKISRLYTDKIEWLYRQFIFNEKQWITVNCPFAYKFLDVIDIKRIVPNGEKIISCRVDLGGLNPFVHTDMVLLWNIEEIVKEASGTVVPGYNSVKIKYGIDIDDFNSGYIFATNQESEDTGKFNLIKELDKDTRKISWTLSVENQQHENFNVLRIADIADNRDITKLFMPCQTNKRNMRHIDRQALRQSKALITRGEAERICSVFSVFGAAELFSPIGGNNNITLANVSVKENNGNNGGDTGNINGDYRDLNYFIHSRPFIKNAPDNRTVVFSFRHTGGAGNEKEKDILVYEKMWFLVSELQLYFDEYKCTGEIL